MGSYILTFLIVGIMLVLKVYDYLSFPEFYGEPFSKSWILFIILVLVLIIALIYNGYKIYQIYRKNKKDK